MLRNKDVKELVIKDLEGRFKDLEGVAVINPRGIDATKTNKLRRQLRGSGLRMLVVRNSLARRAVGESKIKGFESMLEGPSALVFGDASGPTIARALMDAKKAEDKLELRGIFFDGEAYPGEDGVKKVSTFPTREEAIGLVIAAALSPGKKLAGAIKSQGSRIASILKTIEEKAKEKEGAPAEAAAPADAPAEAPAQA
jgi:large subunit ribosomal protein L10